MMDFTTEKLFISKTYFYFSSVNDEEFINHFYVGLWISVFLILGSYFYYIIYTLYFRLG